MIERGAKNSRVVGAKGQLEMLMDKEYAGFA
jgi:hypothetical protein